MSTDAIATLHSDEAERSVLGGLLFRPDVLARLTLEVRDFAHPKHQAVFIAMRNLESSGTAIDPTTVAEELRRIGKLGAFRDQVVDAMEYLAKLGLHVPSTDNVLHYARIVERYARKRVAVESLSKLVHRLRTVEEAEGEDVVLEAIGELQRLDMREQDPTRALGDLMLDEIRSIESDLAAQDRGEFVGGMPTGLDRLDALTGGLPIGVTTLVLGETGHGKSTLAMTFARAAVEVANDRPLVFSYEDGKVSFARRALAQESGVPTQVIGRRMFKGRDAAVVAEEGMAAAGRRRERIARFRGETVDELARTVRRLRARGPEAGARSVGRLVVVDYLQALPKPREKWINSTPEAIAEISQKLEDLAAAEEIAVVVFAQVNDEPMKRQDHRPIMRDCADGRAAAKGCKLGLGIFRPSMYDEAADPLYGEVLVLKNNQGEVKKRAPVRLDLATHTIRDLPVEPVKAEQQSLGGV